MFWDEGILEGYIVAHGVLVRAKVTGNYGTRKLVLFTMFYFSQFLPRFSAKSLKTANT